MATTQSQLSPQQWLARQLVEPLQDALALARRYRQIDAFRDYLAARWTLVAPMCLLLLVTALACALAPIAILMGTRALAALAGLLLAPVVLAGSLLALLVTFFSWLEERSLARALGHRTGRARGKVRRWVERRLGADLGRVPRVPWLLGAVFVAAPLALLAARAPGTVAMLVLALVLAPLAYAKLDR